MGYLLFEFFYTESGALSFLRLFQYISFRSGLAFITAFLIAVIFGGRIITRLYRSGSRETGRDVTDAVIQDKSGTPTMGGVIIILALTVSVLLWCNLKSQFVLWSLASILFFGFIGAKDDLMKRKAGSSEVGMSRTRKLLLQGFFGLILGVVIFSEGTTPYPVEVMTKLYIPFFKDPVIDLSYLYIPFVIFILLSISNAVNFADGLDGLAVVPSCTAIGVYGVFAYIIGNRVYADYLLFDWIPGTGELTILAAAVIGAGLGFLWFNAYPAQIFMGDTGSQALGGLIGTVAILLKQEFLFLIAGGIFLAEAVSVLLQDRIGIARIGRRFFYRAPLHHAFQHRGIAESTVVVRFWIVSVMLALLSIVTIKIR